MLSIRYIAFSIITLDVLRDSLNQDIAMFSSSHLTKTLSDSVHCNLRKIMTLYSGVRSPV